MSISDKLQGEGGYVFVSHSHLDIKKVRSVRNLLEEKGFEPILFYLKSLDDGNQDNTEFLRSLIYNEIDAREFFLYLDSDNARASKWVRQELEYIQKNAPYKLTSIELNDANIVNKIETLISQMRVFLSYSPRDTEAALKIKEALKSADFRVYDYRDLEVGDSWNVSRKKQINDVSKEGIILFILSQNAMLSKSMLDDLMYALQIGARVMPIYIDKMLYNKYESPIADTVNRFPCCFIEDVDDTNELKRLVKLIRSVRTPI